MEWEEQNLFSADFSPKMMSPVFILGVLGCLCHLEYPEFEFI